VVLVWGNIAWVTVKALSHLEDTSRLSELRPKVGWNFWDGVDSNTVEFVVDHQILDPVLQRLSDPAVLLVQIWKISKSAVFNLPLVAPVLDLTIIMVMLRMIVGIDLAEI